MQSEAPKLFTRTYHNYSNINFNDNEIVKIPAQTNFRSLSQVGGMMTDKVQQLAPSRSIYHYNNKISQVEKDYSFPSANDPHFQKNNSKYQEFFCQTKKFVKPYTDCTKYSDNLMKNRQLLRRGQFDLPAEPVPAHHLNVKNKTSFSHVASSTHNTQFLKTKNQLKRSSQTMQNIRKRKPSSDRKNGFDKTLKQHTSTYHTLLNQQRKNRKDQTLLKNSMNRILAAEMINYRLLSQGDYLKPQSVRLEKRLH